jgi:hypothetical protein
MILNLSATDSSSNEYLTDYPQPPALHWGLVLLFHTITFGVFGFVWMFRQAAWIGHIDPRSNALFKLSIAFALWLLALALSLSAMLSGDSPELSTLRGLANVAGYVASIWTYLSMRRVIEDRFGLSLNIVLAIVFNFLYVQYHLTRIARSTGALRGDVLLPVRL